MNKKYIWIFILLISFLFLSDLIIKNKVPLAADIVAHEPIKEWKSNTSEFPHWYPNLFSGMPSYGGFIITSGHPLQSILNMIFINRGVKYWLHFALGGIGMFFLLRFKRFSNYSALFCGISFSLTPYLFGLINAGHSNKIIAGAYIPWLVLGALYLFKNRSLKSVLILSLISSLQLWSKHPQIFYYTWMIIVLWWFIDLLISLIKKSSIRNNFRSLILMIISVIVSLVMVSDPYYDIYTFQKESNRGSKSVLDNTSESNKGTRWDYATQWSFHPAETISFILPYFYGLQNFPVKNTNKSYEFMKQAAYWGYMPFTQSTHYLGLLVILLSIYSLYHSIMYRKIKKEELILWLIAFIFLIIGFGKYFPLLFKPLFYLAPYFSKFRVPSMIYMLFALIMPFIAAFGLEKIIKESRYNPFFQDCLRVFGFFIILFIVFFIFGENILSFSSSGDSRFVQYIPIIKKIRIDLFNKGLLLALLICISLLAIIWSYSNQKINKTHFFIMLILIQLLDFWVISQEFLFLKPYKNMKNQFVETAQVGFLKKDTSMYRIFPADNINSNTYGYWNIESIGGYRPVKLRNYQDLMDVGGFRRPQILNMLNVKYLLTNKTVRNTSFRKLKEINGLYQNLDVLPRAWFVGNVNLVSSQEESLNELMDISFIPKETAIVINYDGPDLSRTVVGDIEIIYHSPNKIIINCETTGGALLVLSEIYYKPGWKCKIDGNPTSIFQTNHVLRSIYVPDGKHNVEFYYDSSNWRLAKVVSRFTFFASIIIIFLLYYREKLINKRK